MITKKMILCFLFITIGFGKLFSQTEEEIRDNVSLDNIQKCLSPVPKEYEELSNKITVNPDLLEEARLLVEQKTKEFSDPSLYPLYKDCLKLKCDYTIPVIVHVLHDGEPIGTGANISYKQILSQIAALNAVFNDKSGGCGADVRISFCLATLDPKNNALVYPGVERILANPNWEGDFNPIWMYFMAPISLKYIDYSTFENIVKPHTIWNPKQYLNIWTYNSIAVPNVFIGPNPAIGYAKFPATANLPAIDLSPNALPSSTMSTLTNDGVVMMADAFTSVLFGGPAPRALVNSTNNEGDVLAHEVGHWLGLRHVNGDDPVCGVDDGCLDTYECTSMTGGCSVAPECNMPAYPVENYMAYTNDVCKSQFTSMQAARMRQALIVDNLRRFLPCSNKCNAPSCFVVANFTSQLKGLRLILENTSAFASGSTILNLIWNITDLSNGMTTTYSYNSPNVIPSILPYPFNPKTKYNICMSIKVMDIYGKTCDDKICKTIKPCNFNINFNSTTTTDPNNINQKIIYFTDASTPSPNLINYWHYNVVLYYSNCTTQSYDSYTANGSIAYTTTANTLLVGRTISLEAGILFGRSLICSNKKVVNEGEDCFGKTLFKKEDGVTEDAARNKNPILDLKLFDKSSSVLEVFPSPTKDELNIELKGKIISRVEIIDMNGKSIRTQSLKSDSKELMNVKDLSTGTYIIRVTDSNEKSYTNKFIKQ